MRSAIHQARAEKRITKGSHHRLQHLSQTTLDLLFIVSRIPLGLPGRLASVEEAAHRADHFLGAVTQRSRLHFPSVLRTIVRLLVLLPLFVHLLEHADRLRRLPLCGSSPSGTAPESDASTALAYDKVVLMHTSFTSSSVSRVLARIAPMF